MRLVLTLVVFAGCARAQIGAGAWSKTERITGLAEIGIEGDVGPLVLGLRARERFGFYLGAEADGLFSWVSTTGALVDVGYRF